MKVRDMKICDGADWFSGNFASIIADELHEVPRFHRKQWEFAAIFDALSKAGVVRADAVGVSFGSGQELPIYALANHVKQIWATDLYTADTSWPSARTDDPENVTAFVRDGAPFETNKDRIFAKSMDMCAIDFPDGHFDFAYSSSAVEHIGGWTNFKRHLDEVRRVLKPGGVYVMTTDISFGPSTECPGNFKFNPERLEWWLQNSGMAYEPVVDCRISNHYINTPLPADIACYITADNGRVHSNLFGMLAMAHCLTGRHPHTSVMLVMKNSPPKQCPVAFTGYEETKAFLFKARRQLATILEESSLFPHPAPWMPDELKSERWATTYMWLGGRSRTVRVKVVVDQPGNITIGVNKSHSDRYWEPEVDIAEAVHAVSTEAEFEFPLLCSDDYTYAIHGRALSGTNLKQITVVLEDARDYRPVEIVAVTKPDLQTPRRPESEPLSASPPLSQPEVPVLGSASQVARSMLARLPGFRSLVREGAQVKN